VAHLTDAEIDAAAERTDVQTSTPPDKTFEPAREATAATPLGVPFMITHAQRAALHKLGYSEQDVSGMTPAYAHDLLRRSGIDLASLTNQETGCGNFRPTT